MYQLLAYKTAIATNSYTASTEMTADIGKHMAETMTISLLGAIISAVGWYLLDKKLGGENPVFMFIPILNIIEMFQLANESPLKILWVLVPVIGAFVFLYYSVKVLIRITQRAGYSGVMVLLMLVPFVNVLYPFLIMPRE